MQDIKTYIQENLAEVKELLVELCKIPAPSHHEEKRAAFVKNWLEAQGAEGVFIDEALNVIYPYQWEEGQEAALFMAHMDTVFPDMEPMPVVEDGEFLRSPGVGDDTANLAILMMMARYFIQNRPKVKRGVIFAANSCEEGLGNLKGSKALVNRYRDVLYQVVSFDGYIDEVCNRAVGSMRYRVEVTTEGGHSYFDFGNGNSIERLSSIIQRLYEFRVPEDGSKTTYNVGGIKGGTSVNTIAQQAEMLYEFRSNNRDSMELVKANFESVIREYQEEGLQVSMELLGERPCGKLANDDPIQKRLEEFCRDVIEKHMGRTPGYTSASTDCNIPFSLGIPAATVGLCLGGKAHTREEWIYLSSLEKGFHIAADLILDQTL